MNALDFNTAVAGVLRSWSYDVDELSEVSGAKSPDLWAGKEGETYLVEVKLKEDDAGRDDAIQAAFNHGELFQERHVLAPRNRIVGIVRHAADQLLAHPEAGTAFRIVWFCSTGRKAKIFLEQVEATLYGTTSLVDLDQSDWFPTCFYFDNSAFFTFRKAIDAAVLWSDSEAWFCLNTYSARLEALRGSQLTRQFGAAVRDPLLFEAQGLAVVADCDVDRKDPSAVIRYLQRKLGREKLMSMNLGYMSVSANLGGE